MRNIYGEESMDDMWDIYSEEFMDFMCEKFPGIGDLRGLESGHLEIWQEKYLQNILTNIALYFEIKRKREEKSRL